MGDVGLFAGLIEALDLAPAWKRRLLKDFRNGTIVRDLERIAVASPNGGSEYQGVLTALAHANPKAAHAMVTDLLSIAGISVVGGRSIGEIADRFVEQAELGASNALPPAVREVIERFCLIVGAPGDAAAALRALAAEANLSLGLSLGPALDLFESRNERLAARGIDLQRIAFSTAFGRGLDYYTGFVFELYDPACRVAGELVAGGRYDGLLTRLGSAAAIPAVGFAVWIERLAALAGAPGRSRK
jgi:ATP phosphoribosyltransferase regulatory subunit